MKTLMRCVLLATMMAGGWGLAACNSGGGAGPIVDIGDTDPGTPDGGNKDVGVDTAPVIPDTGTDVGIDTGTDAGDIGIDVPPVVLDPDANQFLDPANPPIDDEVIVGTLAIGTGGESFKFVSYWADPNEAAWTNPADGTDGFHAHALFPATEMAARSHDRSMWAYSSATTMDYGARLLLVDKDGMNQRLLKSNTGYQDQCKEYFPEFSPDDQWVYYWRSCEVRTSDYSQIPANREYQFRARVTPLGNTTDVQPFVAQNILDPNSPGSPASFLFGHFNDDGSKFIAEQSYPGASVEGIIYSIDTTTMVGAKVIDLAAGFDAPTTTGPGYIGDFVMPGAAGSLYFVVKYSSRRVPTDDSENPWYMVKMTPDRRLTPVFRIPIDSDSTATQRGYSISTVGQDRFVFIGATRKTPAGKVLETGLGLSKLDGTELKYSDQRGIGGRFTSWNR